MPRKGFVGPHLFPLHSCLLTEHCTSFDRVLTEDLDYITDEMDLLFQRNKLCGTICHQKKAARKNLIVQFS
ncbi:hypothetical protein JTE90_013212 [Oedothorax gibbosus]|uniref:Uncharacterized protein n=1 Tax=Oedothorax gibbosus TaxID=931172 RepID=A0AAV6UIM7_9ARAC|nr:hypothetical protein JTE90_013212 [Oedothorax gibbosus]